MMFTIIFHGPFRIAAGAASDGLDATYDPANPLPSSSLKGVTRASAVGILGINAPLVTEIFGDPSVPSPWWWSDGEIEARPAGSGGPGRIRTQLQIDPATFTAADTALRTSGELWPPLVSKCAVAVIWPASGSRCTKPSCLPAPAP
jgi:hypothetical protein